MQERTTQLTPEPFAEACERLYGLVYSQARRWAGPALADDVVQELFLRLLKYKSGDLREVPVGLIVRMTRNAAATARQAESRAQVRAQTGAQTRGREDNTGSRDETVFPDRLPDWLAREIRNLPQRQRDAFLLTELKGLSETEAAKSLEMSRSAISERRRIALTKLREAAQREEAAAIGPRAGG